MAAGFDPKRFNLRTARQRLAAKGDLFAPVSLGARQHDLTAILAFIAGRRG